MTKSHHSPTISFKGKNKSNFAKNQFDSEKYITLPINLEIAWQGFKSYLTDFEELLNSKLFQLEKIQAKDELTDSEIYQLTRLEWEVPTMYNLFIASSSLREIWATELDKKIDSYEVEIRLLRVEIEYLKRGWKTCGDVLRATLEELQTLKNRAA